MKRIQTERDELAQRNAALERAVKERDIQIQHLNVIARGSVNEASPGPGPGPASGLSAETHAAQCHAPLKQDAGMVYIILNLLVLCNIIAYWHCYYYYKL